MGKCVWCSNETNKVSTINDVGVNICSIKCETEYKDAINNGKVAAPQLGLLDSIKSLIGGGAVILFIIFVIYSLIFGKSNSESNSTSDTNSNTESPTSNNSEPSNTDNNNNNNNTGEQSSNSQTLTESDVVQDLKENQISDLLDGQRSLNYNIFEGDFNQDGKNDFIAKFCINSNQSDSEADGGNAVSNLSCINEGIVLYINNGNSFSTVKYFDSEYTEIVSGYVNNVSSIDLIGINNRGIIEFKITAFKDDDPRCCPSDIQTLNIKYEVVDGNKCHLIKE